MKFPRDYYSAIKNIVSLQLVMALSVGLLFFIGVGESYRVAPFLSLTNVCNQAELLQDSINTSLQLGLPIEYQGFDARASNLAIQSEQIESANVLPSQTNVRVNTTEFKWNSLTCQMTDKQLLGVLDIDWKGLIFEKPNNTTYEIVLPLQDKIGQVGNLVVVTEKGLFSDQINLYFGRLFVLSLLSILLVPVLINIAQVFTEKHKSWVLKGTYHFTFVLIAGLIINDQISLYAGQIQSQSSSLANSLSERLNMPSNMGFDLDEDISGLETLLENYRSKSADISHIYLLKNGEAGYRSIAQAFLTQDTQDVTWSKCEEIKAEYQHSRFIVTCLPLGDSPYQVLVKTPWSKVYAKLWNASRNILVLFIASVLLSNLFLNVLLSIQEDLGTRQKNNSVSQEGFRVDPFRALQLIRPIYALGVLMEAINLAFLPAYLGDIFSASDLPVSMAFGLYFVCFAAVLLPAGRWAETHSLKAMMWGALVISSFGLAGLAFTEQVDLILLLRGLAGAGQGVLFIAVQSYLLQIQHQKPEISGAQQLVFGFNISTISGATIGGLLMPILGEKMVFLLGGFIGFACVVYTLIMIRDLSVDKDSSGEELGVEFVESRDSLLHKFRHLLRDAELNKTILLVGFPTKALFAGGLIFVMPMMLREMALDTDLIGQILIFYYIGVLITTALAGYIGRRYKNAEVFLFIGSVGSGIGLLIIGAQDFLLATSFVMQLSDEIKQSLQVLNVLLGVFVVGLSHGCIHAPVISHIVKSEMAHKVGQATTAAYYRFLERLGHVAGPALAAYFLIDIQGNTRVSQFAWVGGILMLLGGVFIILNWRNLLQESEGT